MMVLTSHDKLGNTGCKTGFWLEEFAPQIVLASPKGGQRPLDAKSNEPNFQHRANRRNPYSALLCPKVLSGRRGRHVREPIDAGPSAFINH
jgi:hypothetical protein